MANTLPYIMAGASVLSAGSSVYSAAKGNPPTYAQPISVGQKETVQPRVVSNPFLTTKYKTSQGYVRGK